MGTSLIPRIYLYKQIVDAKLFIDTQYNNKIDLEMISLQACLSKYHFHRLFKECYGKTPLEYLTYVRLRNAKILLSKNMTVQEVCYAVGFSSSSSFIKLFKRKMKMTPSHYSQMMLSQSDKSILKPLLYIPNGFADYLGWKNK